MLTLNFRQAQLASRQLLLVPSFGFFGKVLSAHLIVLLHLAILGDRVVHGVGGEGLVVREKTLLKMLSLGIC